jgi:hypothetical protein
MTASPGLGAGAGREAGVSTSGPPNSRASIAIMSFRPPRAVDDVSPDVAGLQPKPAGTGGPGPIVIHGSAIPRGVELSIGYRQDPQDREISFKLIKAGAPLTCTSIPDNGQHS